VAYNRRNVLLHELPNQISSIKAYLKDKMVACKKIGGEIYQLINSLLIKLLHPDHELQFNQPDNFQRRVTQAQITQAMESNTVYTTDAENCVQWLQNSSHANIADSGLNSVGNYQGAVGAGLLTNDFIYQQEPNRLIQFFIPDNDSRNALDIETPFEVGRYIWFKQTTGHAWYQAAIMSWNRGMQDNNGVLWPTYQLNCYFHGDKSEIENFCVNFATTPVSHGNRPGARCAINTVQYRIRNEPLGIIGQIEKQGLTQTTANSTNEFRLCAGDYVRSARPNLDSMSYFSSLSITCNSGILFKPTVVPGFSRNVLLNLPIENPFSVSASDDFQMKGVSLSPRGDIYYSSTEPRLHQMQTNIPLRHARLFLEIQPRDSLNPVPATLAPKGQFEILLGFWKR